jgi:hypothetical protein
MNKNITPFNENKLFHGYWERHYENTLWFKKFYVNGISNGYEETYDLELIKPKEGEVLINMVLYIDDSRVTLNFNL